MSDVSPVGSTASAATLREFARQVSKPPGDGADSTLSGDRVEISELANFLNRLAELPDARARKVVEVRRAIADGTYETSEKLDIATNRLLHDLPLEG